VAARPVHIQAGLAGSGVHAAKGDRTVTRRPPTLLRSLAHAAGSGQPGSPGRTPRTGCCPATPPAGPARAASGSPANPFRSTRLCTSETSQL
jgi:hypothetical protein